MGVTAFLPIRRPKCQHEFRAAALSSLDPTHLLHNANDHVARLRILFVSITTNLFIFFAPSLQTRVSAHGYWRMRWLTAERTNRRHRFYGVEAVVMILSKASLTDRTETICMD